MSEGVVLVCAMVVAGCFTMGLVLGVLAILYGRGFFARVAHKDKDRHEEFSVGVDAPSEAAKNKPSRGKARA